MAQKSESLYKNIFPGIYYGYNLNNALTLKNTVYVYKEQRL